MTTSHLPRSPRPPAWSVCLALFGLVILLGTSPVQADTFLLANGARLEGDWVNAEKKPLTEYVIRTASGAEVVLAKDQVVSVQHDGDYLASYYKALKDLPDTPEAHWKMAERCGQAKLTKQQHYHLKRVLQLDPNHEGARRALGYVKLRDEWILPEEHFQRLGYVRYRNGWRLPQEVELDARKEQREREEAKWRDQVKRWRNALLRGKPDAQQEALRGFREMNSVYAAEAIANWLANPKEPHELKLIYIDVLGRLLPAPPAVQGLVDRVVHDPSQEIVDRAIEQLKQHGPHQYTHAFLPYLKSKDNTEINRAAYGLGQLGDPTAIPALIDALVTQHRKALAGPGIQTNFGNGGGGGLTAGRGAKVVQYSVQNKNVVTALSLLTPDGVNFGYDKQAWRQWYARSRLPSAYDLRRDN